MGWVSRRTEPSQAGQATPEYVGVVLLVAAIFAVLVTVAGPAVPGGELARALAAKIVCAVGVSDCEEAPFGPTALERTYGPELAALVAAHAPHVAFEDDDFVSLPVDFRLCRRRACADSIRPGRLRVTQTGLAPVAFTHLIDCREPDAVAATAYECEGERAGRIYIQYWLYYPDSATRPFGSRGYHVDDWESTQLRIDGDGTVVARASSHHGYNGRTSGLAGLASDAGTVPRAGWDADLGTLHVAAGSHAGMTQAQFRDSRWIEAGDLRLVPLEEIVAAGDLPTFAVTPPWEKDVWRDPESMGT